MAKDPKDLLGDERRAFVEEQKKKLGLGAVPDPSFSKTGDWGAYLKKLEGMRGSGDSGGGGGGSPSMPDFNPFPGNEGVNLRSSKEIGQDYQKAIEKGQRLLEALGHESFRDLAAKAFANKFTLPENFEQLISGEGTQAVTQANQLPQYDPGIVGTQSRQALQQGLSTLPQTGSPAAPGVPPSMSRRGPANQSGGSQIVQTTPPSFTTLG